MLPQRLPDSEQAHADTGRRYAFNAGDFLGRVTFQALLQQVAVAPGATLQQPMQLDLLQVHLVGSFHAVHGRQDFGAEPGAEQIACDRVNPKAHKSGVAELVAELPTTGPGGLRDFLSFLDRSASGQQKTARRWETRFKSFRIFCSLHHFGGLQPRGQNAFPFKSTTCMEPLAPRQMQKLPHCGHWPLIAVLASSDKTKVKPLFLIALAATLASAESHPSWWTYASPDASALVGIHWDNVRHSPFASAIQAELSSTGALAFPDLECLRQAREIVISAPPLLAAEAGSFPAATVKDQAQRLGLRRAVYRGVTLWFPEQADKLGVAQISEQLLLVGARKALEGAVDRSLLETGRQYSPLLPRAARFSQTGDLWVVAVKLPDPLAGLFVPLDADASQFLGQVSLRDGLAVEASFDADSEAAAQEFAREFQKNAPSFPAVARGLAASADQSRVTITLQVSSESLVAALSPAVSRVVPPAAVPAPVPTPAAAPVPAQVAARVPAPAALAEIAAATPPGVAPPVAPAPPLPSTVKFEVTHTENSQPQIVRIFGLDEGVREIVLPPY